MKSNMTFRLCIAASIILSLVAGFWIYQARANDAAAAEQRREIEIVSVRSLLELQERMRRDCAEIVVRSREILRNTTEPGEVALATEDLRDLELELRDKDAEIEAARKRLRELERDPRGK